MTRGVCATPPWRRASKLRHRPQSSSASRFTAGAAGFLNLSQSGERSEIGSVSIPLLLRRLERDDDLFPTLQVFQPNHTVGISGLQNLRALQSEGTSRRVTAAQAVTVSRPPPSFSRNAAIAASRVNCRGARLVFYVKQHTTIFSGL